MRFAQPGQLESQLVANFEYNTSMQGGSRPAYVPVCASGSQALTIHYVENNRPIKAGEMVLLDAGCEWGGYASDITRTSRLSRRGHSRLILVLTLKIVRHLSGQRQLHDAAEAPVRGRPPRRKGVHRALHRLG